MLVLLNLRIWRIIGIIIVRDASGCLVGHLIDLVSDTYIGGESGSRVITASEFASNCASRAI